MGVKLMQIAESKVRQLGGDVCGVLVRKDEKLAAVDEHGRVQWLQGDSEHTAYLEGMNAHLRAELKAARAQGGEHWAKSNPGRADQYRAEALAARDVLGLGSEDSEDVSPSDIRNVVNAMRLPVYAQPQPAQQSNQDDVIALLTNALANIRDTDASAKTLQSMAALALRAAKETCDE